MSRNWNSPRTTINFLVVQSNLVRTNTDKANFPLVRTKANPMVGQASIQVKIIRLRRTSVQRTFAKTNYFQVWFEQSQCGHVHVVRTFGPRACAWAGCLFSSSFFNSWGHIVRTVQIVFKRVLNKISVRCTNFRHSRDSLHFVIVLTCFWLMLRITCFPCTTACTFT